MIKYNKDKVKDCEECGEFEYMCECHEEYK
jgi:hypothetical protein